MTIPIRQGIRRYKLDVKTGKGTTTKTVDLCTYHANHAEPGGSYQEPDGVWRDIVRCVSVKIDLVAIGRCAACKMDCMIGSAKP